MNCPYCNKEISDNEKYCPKCGQVLNNSLDQDSAKEFWNEININREKTQANYEFLINRQAKMARTYRQKTITILVLMAVVALIALLGFIYNGKTRSEVKKEVAGTNIPGGAMKYEGHYYYVYDNAASWTDARQKCIEKGGHLVTLSSEEESKKVYRFMLSNHLRSAFIGAKVYGNADSENWKWITGEEFTYTKWQSGEPNVGSKHDSIYAAFYKKDHSKWRALSNDYLTGYICEWDNLDGVSNDMLVAGEVDIHPEAVEYDGHHYYLIPHIYESWEEAESVCRDRGGHLAVINNKKENNFICDYMEERDCYKAYFGYSDIESEGAWKWIDGYESDYTNWGDGEPDDDDRYNYGMLYRNGDEFYWDDSECESWDDYPFLCEWEQ